MTRTATETTIIAGVTAPVPSARAARRQTPTPAMDTQSEQTVRQDAEAETERLARLEAEGTAIVTAWTDSLSAAISVSKTVESRTVSVYAAFAGLGLIGDHKPNHAATLKASMLLCSPEKLASLASVASNAASLAIVRATIQAWEHAVSMSAHATDKDTQTQGTALKTAMARSFYNASYAMLQKSIDDAKTIQRQAAKATNEARQARIAARQTAIEAAVQDATHPLRWLVDAYAVLDSAILAHSGDAPLVDLREYVIDMAYASRRAAETPAPAAETVPAETPAIS